MKDRQIDNKYFQAVIQTLFWMAIIGGIIIRLYIYISNRNFILDEANVARNIYERGFASLLTPLNYEQYAPPLFLLAVKLCSTVFGYSEYALRLYPFLTGILAIILFARLLKKLVPRPAALYPMLLFSVGYLFIRYSTELKQYMPDVAVVIGLLLLVVSTDIRKVKPLTFITTIFVAGTFCLWASMPSVFLLTGIACYYIIICIQERRYSRLYMIILPVFLLGVQFTFYYYQILLPQAKSDYLQNFHSQYFLVAAFDKVSFQHNIELIQHILSFTGGKTAIPFYTNLLFIIVAIASLFRKQFAVLALLLVPVLALFGASLLNRYPLLDRVILFVSPIVLLLIGYGLSQVLLMTKHIAVKGVVFVFCSINFVSYIGSTTSYPFKYEELTTGLSYVEKNNIRPENLYVYHSSNGPFVYYTTIHPEGVKEWGLYSAAHILNWYTNYDSLGAALATKSQQHYAFLCTNISLEEFDQRNEEIKKHLSVVDSIRSVPIRSYIFQKQ